MDLQLRLRNELPSDLPRLIYYFMSPDSFFLRRCNRWCNQKPSIKETFWEAEGFRGTCTERGGGTLKEETRQVVSDFDFVFCLPFLSFFSVLPFSDRLEMSK